MQLQNSTDDRDCENRLVLLLGFDQFDFIKTVRKHRQMILYCTLLASAQSDSEREQIEAEMSSDGELMWILRALGETAEQNILEVSLTRIICNPASCPI